MKLSKDDIIAKLQKDILSLQGFKTTGNNTAVDRHLGPILQSFPNNIFPVGAMHEFIYSAPEAAAATSGFVSGLLAALMQQNGMVIWIGAEQSIFPPALQLFGIAPDKLIFINLKKEKEMLWAMEEALKCTGLSAVVAETPELGFTASRRLQLAVEESKVTGFILRQNPRNLATTACVTRWKITSIPSVLEADMPGVGFPRWQVDLLKVRNGKPNCWKVACSASKLHFIYPEISIAVEPQKKTG